MAGSETGIVSMKLWNFECQNIIGSFNRNLPHNVWGGGKVIIISGTVSFTHFIAQKQFNDVVTNWVQINSFI